MAIFSKIVSLLKKRWYLVLIALILLVIVMGRLRKKPEVLFAYQNPIRQDVVKTLDVTARVSAARTSDLKFLGGGKIVWVGAQEGDSVKKGQRIATIDTADLRASLQKSLNDYMTNRLSFEQGLKDRKDSAITSTLETLAKTQQLSLDNAVIGVQLQSIAIKNSSLVSPIDGILVKSPVTVAGEYVTAADTFTIVDPMSLEFVGEVDESDIGSVSSGMPVTVKLDAYQEKDFTTTLGKIAYVASISSDTSGGTVFVVRAPVLGEDVRMFRLGLTGSMHIEVAKKSNVLTVPADATVSHDGKTYVRVQTSDPNKPKEQEVQIGLEGDTAIEILSGISQSDSIAIPK
ncbi:MAG TPA: efflux RND transporter periplasmic adaptor subunit [Patescibacteria group bacterium]|nr:efflux RND transporter periplasmic adaptor subunit [Patescibacteria group bacterium]